MIIKIFLTYIIISAIAMKVISDTFTPITDFMYLLVGVLFVGIIISIVGIIWAY